jgi:hypothetical protein
MEKFSVLSCGAGAVVSFADEVGKAKARMGEWKTQAKARDSSGLNAALKSRTFPPGRQSCPAGRETARRNKKTSALDERSSSA